MTPLNHFFHFSKGWTKYKLLLKTPSWLRGTALASILRWTMCKRGGTEMSQSTQWHTLIWWRRFRLGGSNLVQSDSFTVFVVLRDGGSKTRTFNELSCSSRGCTSQRRLSWKRNGRCIDAHYAHRPSAATPLKRNAADAQRVCRLSVTCARQLWCQTLAFSAQSAPTSACQNAQAAASTSRSQRAVLLALADYK